MKKPSNKNRIKRINIRKRKKKNYKPVLTMAKKIVTGKCKETVGAMRTIHPHIKPSSSLAYESASA